MIRGKKKDHKCNDIYNNRYFQFFSHDDERNNTIFDKYEGNAMLDVF